MIPSRRAGATHPPELDRVTESDQGDIERFVRGTLGCRCPDEVFRTVSVSRLPAVPGRPPVLQLLIGSRLLIHVAAAPAEPSAAGWLEQLATNGRAARDRHGYNRYRLVIAAEAPGCAVAGLEARFARALARDERAHLHVLDAAQLPAELAMTAD
jgi:hypothetical protein